MTGPERSCGAPGRHCPRTGGVHGFRTLEQATTYRDLSWYGRTNAALCEVGRPDLIAYVDALPSPERGGAVPAITQTATVLADADVLLICKAIDLAYVDWPHHPTHYPYGGLP